MGNLHDKIALVTGASRGIGRAIALRLAQDGATVVVNYLANYAAAQATVDAILAAGGRATAIKADIAARRDISTMFEAVARRYGRLDILVANAGHAVFKPLADYGEEDFDRTCAVNIKGTFFCLQEALRLMPDGGRIVCVSTIGTIANMAGGACYFGSKAAIEQFCRVVAREVAPRGITVNVVSPGFIDTDMMRATLAVNPAALHEEILAMTPLSRLGEGADIAGAVAFLVGPDARWMTRQNLAMDGGVVSR